MAKKRNAGGNAQQRVAASTARKTPSTRQEIVEDLRNAAAGGKPGGNRINEAYAAYRARKEQEKPERAMDEAVDAWVQWNQARTRTPQYRMAQDEAAEREASGYVSPKNYAASIRANKRAADRIRSGGVIMSDGRYHVGRGEQEELDRLAQSTARSELAMRAQEDETAMFRGSDYWLRRANELERKRKAARSGYGGMMQGGTAFREVPEFTEQDRQDWDKAREYYYQVKNAERWGSMPEDLRQKALEAAGYTTDSVLAWQDGDEAALAGMTPDQRAQRQRDQRARRNQIAAILAGAGYEPEEIIEYASRVRNAERMQQEMAGLSKDVTGRGAEGVARGVYGTLQSYATNLLSPIGSVGLLAQKLFRGGAGAEQYRPVDYNTPSMYFSQGTSTIRGAVGGQMGDVGRFVYDTVNSAVDSGVRMLVGQALGGGGIKPSPDMTEAAAKLNRFVSGFISTQMSGEVFANSFVQAKENGSTDADALLDSVTAAVIEGLTEKYSVEAILKNPNGLTWTALRNNFLAEGSEEMASDFLNTIYDELKNGDDSELRTQYRELLASGATENDAFNQVFGGYVKQVVLDGLAGGLSGIAMGGVAEYATNKRYEAAYADPADTQALLDEARAVNPESRILRQAEQRVAKGKGITGYQARELMGRNEERLAPLKQASEKYGEQSGAMQATYQEGQDVAQYDMSYRVAYEMGKAGTKLSAAQTSEATDYLTDAQKQAAWYAGRDARTRLSDVSEVANGRALLNGQIAQVQTISVQDGKLMAEVRQGESVQTVALDSLKVDAGTRTLAEGAKQYGSAAGTVFEQYKAGQDVAAYLRAADMAAAVGMASPSASSETVLRNLQAGQLGKALSGEQITAIYKAGQTAGRAQLRKTGMTRLGTGTVTFEQSAKGAKLNARQKAAVQFIRDLAKVTGIDFTIYKSSADSTGRLQGANGAYRDGTVHVDLNAGAAYEGKLESASMLRTVSHELTHYMAEAASTEFSALQDFMVQRLSQWEGHSIQDLVEGKMATAEQAGHPITAQEALEEVVADGCEMMLRDSKAVQQLAEENRTLFEKVRDWMKKFFESLRKAFEGVEAVHPESIHMMENYAEELQKLWDEAFTAAVKNAKTANVDGVAEVERFSMRAPVEETRDLIAVHNLTEENLESSLNLGGLPSPSIAIVKAEQGHSKYGPISIVFDKSTIDPQADSRNKIYGSDAWTPTVPRVEYQVNSKRAGDLEYELNSLAKQTAGGIFSSASALRSLGIDDASSLNRQQLAEKLADNDTVRAAYLADQGKTLDPERMVKQFNRYGNEALQMLIDRVGVQELAGAVAELETGNWDAANGISDAVREIIRDTYEQNHRGFLDRKPELKQARLDRYMENNVSRVTVEDFVKDAWEMYQDGGQTKDEIDRMATREKLREAANTEDVQSWIDEKLDGVLGKAGIYNGKDRYTPSGNSRSFAQLHYDYTLENIVRAMNGLQQVRGEGIWGASAESFVAVGTPDYRSIDEVRADKGRLREATEEEYDALKAHLDPMIEEIITGVRSSNKAHSDNQFEEIDIIGSLLLDAAKGTKTTAAIRSVFRKEGYTISDALIAKAQSLYSEAAKMPTKYFEAKPQRAVSFDEAKAIIVPDNTSAALVQRLEKGGANVISYKAGDEQARLEALNAQEGVKFSERVTDKKTLDFLNRQKTVKTYKTMQLVDGKLYPPMAARTNGQYEDYSVLGQWEQATEHPELVRDGRYKLDKGKGQGSISAAYNPYMHSSNLVLNDQFSGAYARPNLVTVECEVPVSELTSGYRAEGAKDAVGWHAWHTGTVAGQLRAKTGTERQVLLSRWIKPVRILSDTEVAQMYKRLLNGTGIAVPDNVVTPSLLRELRKAGVSIKESGRVTARNAQGDSRVQYSDGDNTSQFTEKEYRRLLTKNPVKVSKQEYAMLRSQIMSRYAGMQESDIPVLDIFRIGDYRTTNRAFEYYVRNRGSGTHAIVKRKKISDSVHQIQTEERGNGYNGTTEGAGEKTVSEGRGRGSGRGSTVPYGYERTDTADVRSAGQFEESGTDIYSGEGASDRGSVKRQERDITITPAEILDEINLDAVTGTAAYDALRDYKNALAEREDIRQKLEAQQDLAQNGPAGERVKAKNRAGIYQKQFDRADTKVKQLRRNTALRQFVESEMAYVNGRQDALNQADAVHGRYTERFEQRLEEAYQINRTVQERYASMAQQYGTIPAGETPARTVAVPKRTEKGNRVSRTVRTAMEAQATTEEGVRALKKAVVEGNFSYLPITDKAAGSKATETIKDKGYQKALADWTVSMSKGHPGKDAVALGFQLYNQALNSGDTKTAVQVLSDLASRVREGAQMVQAVRMLKKLSPDNQLYSMQLGMKALQENVNKRYGKKAPKLQMNEVLVNNLLEAENEAQKEAAQKAIYRDIASQLPHTFMDRWNSWRYLCMLGNARTHVRNILGNAGFVPVRRMKDAVALGIEAAYSKAKGGNVERSKGFVSPNSDLYKLAKADYENIADLITGGGKYNDAASGIESMKSAFGEKGVWKYLSKIADANSFALDAEDVWFSKPAYAQSLAGYLKANKITAEQFNADEAIRDKARAYAVKEAQRATYRDYNDFSNFIAKVGRTKRGGGTTAKVASTLMEGVLPFRRTPANILVRGVEYSPIGLAQGIYQATRGVKTGKYTAAQAIDRISAGLTGTVLVALGALLTAHGILTPPDDDDDKQAGFDKLRGAQSYALKLGKTYVTVDWLAPEALPVFVGSQLSKLFSGDSEGGLKALYSALTTISEPMLEMSMLSSLQDVIENVSYADSKLMAILSTAATNYLTQAFPTLAGQVERITESERETTFATEDSPLTKDIQYILAKVMNKLPGEFQQIPYIDAWGRHEETGTVLARAFNNLLNPAYLSYDKSEPFEDELQRLYDLGYNNLLPQRVKQSQKVEGETLTQDQYVTFAETKGKTQYEALKGIIGSFWYQELSDAARGDLLSMAYSYADGVAKLKVNKDADVSKWIREAQAAVEDGGDISEILRGRLDEDVIDFQTANPQYADLSDNQIHGYLEYCEPVGVPLDVVYDAVQTCKNFESDKDSDGKTISGSKKQKVVKYIQSLGLSRTQAKALWDVLKGNWKDTDTPWE